ncbi:hypothetical protein UJ101_01588 [Flavobacteriaceae bacterium UJ101]|nr:hypothetical protein UJ101_01588 [Flavobacteriaceae bacterium UJ101]
MLSVSFLFYTNKIWNESDIIHSPNEHFGIFNFYKGIETISYFYKYYTELEKG